MRLKRFNEHNVIGSVLMWRSAVGEPYQQVTVKSIAFIRNNQPLVYFEERAAYCSIDPLFIQ